MHISHCETADVALGRHHDHVRIDFQCGCGWRGTSHTHTEIHTCTCSQWCARMAHFAIVAARGQMITIHMGLQCCVCTFHPCATVARWRNKNVWARDSRCHKGIAYSKHMPLVVFVTNNNCIVTTPPCHQHCHIATLPSAGSNGNFLDPDVSVPIVIFLTFLNKPRVQR